MTKVITPDVIKAPTMKGVKSTPLDSKEETKGGGDSGIGGFRKVTDSVTVGKAEASIVGADKRTLSGMNMTLASKDKYK